MKVLAIIPDFIKKPSGGLGEQFRNLYENLKENVDFYVIGHPEKNDIKNYKWVTNPFPELNHQTLNIIYGQSCYIQKALEFKVEFDIIHAFDWSTFFSGVICSRIFNKPLVASVNLSIKMLNYSNIYMANDPLSPDGLYINGCMNRFEQYGLECANKIIHVSKYYYDIFSEYKDKSVIIPNGIDINSWNKKRTPTLPGKNKLKFCYIGRASAMKGIDLILESTIPDDVDFYFVIANKAREEDIYKKILKKVNDKNIFIIPGLYGQDKIDFLYGMDSLVIPSIHEPFGIVALEAMISENLIISTCTGGLKEIISDNNIPHIEIKNSLELSSAFEKVKKINRGELETFKVLGKAAALKYNWSKPAEDLYNLYKTTIGEKVIINDELDIDYIENYFKEHGC